MVTTQSQASKRLFKKLSALRATLSQEERDILDNLVTASEVGAHKMTAKASNKAAAQTSFRILFDPNSEEYKIQE